MTGKDTPAQFSARPGAGGEMSGQLRSAGPDYDNWLGNAWVYCLSEMGAELSQFIANRIREDVRTQHAILHCKDPAGVHQIQMAFIDKAIEDYTAETGRMVEIGSKALGGVMPERPAS